MTLSACETGVGDLKNGDGVYGLRRALVLAGAESQVLSLWRVNDGATKQMMSAYYERLDAGAGRTEALRDVQLSMLSRPETAHPFYWASFIQSGEWRGLGEGGHDRRKFLLAGAVAASAAILAAVLFFVRRRRSAPARGAASSS